MNFARDHLRAFIERIEHIEGEIKELNSDKSDIYAEAKGSGFDVKAMRAVIGMRRKDSAELAEHTAIIDTYLVALGMAPDTEPSRAPVPVHTRSGQGTALTADEVRAHLDAREFWHDPETGELASAPSAERGGGVTHETVPGDASAAHIATDHAGVIAYVDSDSETEPSDAGEAVTAETNDAPPPPSPHSDPAPQAAVLPSPRAEDAGQAGEGVATRSPPPTTYDAGPIPAFLRRTA